MSETLLRGDNPNLVVRVCDTACRSTGQRRSGERALAGFRWLEGQRARWKRWLA